MSVKPAFWRLVRTGLTLSVATKETTAPAALFQLLAMASKHCFSPRS
jgi:hypothetical protein